MTDEPLMPDTEDESENGAPDEGALFDEDNSQWGHALFGDRMSTVLPGDHTTLSPDEQARFLVRYHAQGNPRDEVTPDGGDAH